MGFLQPSRQNNDWTSRGEDGANAARIANIVNSADIEHRATNCTRER